MSPPRPDFYRILTTMEDNDVDFIVVGGVCAVLHGAPVTTFDMDLVHSREPGNLSRLLSALESLDAVYRGHSAKPFGPKTEELRVADSLMVHVLALDKLIELKQIAGREKDLAVIPVLQSTLAEKLRRERRQT